MNMKKILTGIDVEPLMKELNEHPLLWNYYPHRTESPTSPHREASDIWLRYRDYADFDPNNPADFASKHESVWYVASFLMPTIRHEIELITEMLGIDELGGCLITKIPPGKQVYPHNDAGFWHSEYYNDKYLLLLQSAYDQKFCYQGEEHRGNAGDLFSFNNLVEHWVVNNSDTDRISLIIAGRSN